MSIFGPDYPGDHFEDDFAYLCGVAAVEDVFDKKWLNFASRGRSKYDLYY